MKMEYLKIIHRIRLIYDLPDISEFTSIQFAEILFDLEEGVEQFTQGNHYFPTGHLYKIMDELQGSGPFLDSRNHNQTRKEEYESKLTVPSWALDMVKQLTSVIDDTLKTATGVLSFLAKRCPYLFPDLTREPTEKDLFTFAEAIGNNFKQLGHALGVSASKLDRISMDNETSLMKIYSMLKEWQRSNPLKASLESLVKTMKTCKSVTIDWDKIGKACL